MTTAHAHVASTRSRTTNNRQGLEPLTTAVVLARAQLGPRERCTLPRCSNSIRRCCASASCFMVLSSQPLVFLGSLDPFGLRLLPCFKTRRLQDPQVMLLDESFPRILDHLRTILARRIATDVTIKSLRPERRCLGRPITAFACPVLVIFGTGPPVVSFEDG